MSANSSKLQEKLKLKHTVGVRHENISKIHQFTGVRPFIDAVLWQPCTYKWCVYNYTPSDSKWAHQRRHHSVHSEWFSCNHDSKVIQLWLWVNIICWRTRKRQCFFMTSDKDFQWIRCTKIGLHLPFCCSKQQQIQYFNCSNGIVLLNDVMSEVENKHLATAI